MTECRLCDFVLIFILLISLLYDVLCEQVQLRFGMLWLRTGQESFQQKITAVISSSFASSCRHAMHIISVVRMWKRWLGAQFARSDSLQIHLRLSSSICRLRFTSDSNQNHFKLNHFKLESKLFQTQFRFQITFTSNSSLIHLSVKTLPVQNQLFSSFRCATFVLQDPQIQTRSLQPDWSLDSS